MNKEVNSTRYKNADPQSPLSLARSHRDLLVKTANDLRSEIAALVAEFHAVAFPPADFLAGQTSIPYAGRVFDERELQSLVDCALDFWLTTGRFAAEFEQRFARMFQRRHALLCNSGSSANLLAVSALTTPELGDRRLQPGDEVITVAAGFPTTVNPIVQNGGVPVFVDVQIPTYNIDVSQLEAARSDRTRAVILAHTLGNPFDLDAVVHFCQRNRIWLIEDCCDAVGSTWKGQAVGSFGDLATVSFYPAHHITMGEGGCVLADDHRLKKIVESFRDWGRDCWCAPGLADTCGKRFNWQLGDLPPGYDHKYIYSHRGYNLKLTDMQAAVGVAQLDKLPGFVAARQQNFAFLLDGLQDLQEFLELPMATPGSEPSWFGFPIGIRTTAPFGRRDAIRFLEARKIATRLLFAGNLIRQPAYAEVAYRQIGSLPNTDHVMNNVFWIGVYPGLLPAQMEFMVSSLRDMVNQLSKS